MNRYDIVFIGQMGTMTVVPFIGPPFIEHNSPVIFSALAASCLGIRVAAVTKVSEDKEYLLEPLRAGGIDVIARPGEVGEIRVKLPSANPDERRARVVKVGDTLQIGDIPPLEPCLVHLCCFGPRGILLDLMRALKTRGFRLSIDMQSFVLQPDRKTGAVHIEDVPEKKEILAMTDFVKLDTVEAQALTGVDVLQRQAEILEEWGSPETVITCAEGALARSKGTTTFLKFANSGAPGRMGRGDTVMGSYLARRLDHSVEESLRFAVALTSLKLETVGPFKGTLQDVLERMKRVT
jgi:sugar/nucleoside kinase (ribokinase family)